MTRPLALVLGATGGIGGALAARLIADGWRVRAAHRDPDRAGPASLLEGLEWVKADALDADAIVSAARGAEIIVHAVNPPGYRNWAGLQMPMLEASLAAARATGARHRRAPAVSGDGLQLWPRRLPPDRGGGSTEPAHPQGGDPCADGGGVAHADVRSLIVRAGDFFGPRPGNNWLSQGMVRAGRPIMSVSYPGPLEIRHTWAFLPDVAETFVRLLATALPDRAAFHMQGHAVTGHELVAAIEAAAGRRIAVKRLPWLAMAAVAPFNETLRELQEVRYLWREPILLDNSRLRVALGDEPRTPLARAMRAALAGQGSLPASLANAA